MIRRPPRSTRTDTLFPYTTLFRSLDLSYFFINNDNSTDEFGSREEVTFGIASRLNENWSVGFRHRRDIEEDRALLSSISLAYQDECFLIEAVAQRSNYDDREIEEDDSVFVRVVFKYLGGVSDRKSVV